MLFAISTDALTMKIEAKTADEAAEHFAQGESLYRDCTTAAEVAAKAEELGGWAEINEIDYPETIEVGFEHCSGGDSKLPKEDRGFFDFYVVQIDLQAAKNHMIECGYDGVFEAAEDLAHRAMYNMVSEDHPDWVTAAYTDLAAVASR